MKFSQIKNSQHHLQHQMSTEGVFFFLAYTLPDDHSASEVNKENTAGNIPKLTQHYSSPDVVSDRESIE